MKVMPGVGRSEGQGNEDDAEEGKKKLRLLAAVDRQDLCHPTCSPKDVRNIKSPECSRGLLRCLSLRVQSQSHLACLESHWTLVQIVDQICKDRRRARHLVGFAGMRGLPARARAPHPRHAHSHWRDGDKPGCAGSAHHGALARIGGLGSGG